MQSATFTEFRNNLKHFFDIVENGESINIYRHGKPVAVVMPVTKHNKNMLASLQPLKIPGVSLTRALLADRKERSR